MYSRLSHRHIAIAALYCLLTIGVLGLLVILCIFNDTEHNYLFDSASASSEVQLAKYSNDLANQLKYNQSILRAMPTTPSDTKNELENDSNSDEEEEAEEQQHIYIDELYTEKTPKPSKPKRVYDNYISYRKLAITTDTTRKVQNISGDSPKRQKSGESARKGPNFRGIHFDDDTDNDDENKTFYQNELYNDNESVASGSGAGSQFMEPYNRNRNRNRNTNHNDNDNMHENEHFDLETKKFIKRIGNKLLQLSKRNTSDHSLASKRLSSTNRKKQRKHKTPFGPSTIESKINYYRSLEILLPTSNPSVKFENVSKWSQQSGSFPLWTATQIKTRRIIGNEKKSAERSRQLLLCEKGESGGVGDGGGGGGGGGAVGAGGELCRMLFKET